MDQEKLFVGINVGKHYVDVALGRQGAVKRFPNDDSGIAEILALFKGSLESSASCWRPAVGTSGR